MKPSKASIALCSVAAAIGVLAWQAADTGTSLPGSGLCTVGVGVGVRRGTVVEPCGVRYSEGFSSAAVLSQTRTQTLARSLHHDVMVEIYSLNTDRIPTVNSLGLMVR